MSKKKQKLEGKKMHSIVITMNKIFFLPFLLICFSILLFTGCSTNYIHFTAANTGIPVLLSKIDRIGGDFKTNFYDPEQCTEDQIFTAETKNYYAFSSGPYADSVIRSKLDPKNVDAIILKKTLADSETNVHIHYLEAYHTSLYVLMGWAEYNGVKMKATYQKAAGLNYYEIMEKE